MATAEITVTVEATGAAYVALVAGAAPAVRDSVALGGLDEANAIAALDRLVLDFDHYGRLTGIRVEGSADSVLSPSLMAAGGRGMTGPSQTGAPSLVDTLNAYVDTLPEADRADALHQVFYGFYTRVAIIDRTTHELARAARDEDHGLDGLAPSLAEALRDNALHVGQELFAGRVRTMAAMGYVSTRLAEQLDGAPGTFTLTHAVAFDPEAGTLRTYDLARPGEHPDLPYDATAYDPESES